MNKVLRCLIWGVQLRDWDFYPVPWTSNSIHEHISSCCCSLNLAYIFSSTVINTSILINVFFYKISNNNCKLYLLYSFIFKNFIDYKEVTFLEMKHIIYSPWATYCYTPPNWIYLLLIQYFYKPCKPSEKNCYSFEIWWKMLSMGASLPNLIFYWTLFLITNTSIAPLFMDWFLLFNLVSYVKTPVVNTLLMICFT